MKTPQQQNSDSSKSIAENTCEGTVFYAPPDPFDRKQVVQREVSISTDKEDEHTAMVRDYENALDAAVDQAYNHVMAAPRLGVTVADIDGHTGKWVEDWDKEIEGKRPSSFHTSFGYVIESLTTVLYLPSAPAGVFIQLQGVRGGTRPDIILYNESGDIAWLDITASESKKHILAKEGSWKGKHHASEVTYKSLTDDDIEVMKENKDNDNPAGFNAEALKEQLARAEVLNQIRNKRWFQVGGDLDAKYKSWKISHTSLYETKQNAMLDLLIDAFGLDIKKYGTDSSAFESDGKKAFRAQAPHIIRALGLNCSTYGFASGGRNQGRSWLQVHDPSAPHSMDEKELNQSEERLNELTERIAASELATESSGRKKRPKSAMAVEEETDDEEPAPKLRRSSRIAKRSGTATASVAAESEPHYTGDDTELEMAGGGPATHFTTSDWDIGDED